MADADVVEGDVEPTAWWIIGLGFGLSIGIGLTAGGDRAIWGIAALGLVSSTKLLIDRLRATGTLGG